MKSAPSSLGRALAISLALHAAVIAAGAQLSVPVPRIVPLSRAAQADLTVWLRDPPVELDAAARAQPRLRLLERSSRHASAAATIVAKAAPKPAPAVLLGGDSALIAAEHLQRELPYPPQAIERGLQGEALVLLFLDAAGNAMAARIESSSGHAILDDAALRAVRSLRALPASAPREALLSVRFRLR